MSRNTCKTTMLVAVVVMCCTLAQAKPFQPLFRILRINGDCSVMKPAGTAFEPAQDGSAYPYGTQIRTGRKSSLIVEFSEGNQCTVLANTLLTVAEDAREKSLKIIKLTDGKVEVLLEETFHKSNGLNIETCCATCAAIGCTFSVEARREENLATVVFIVTDGEIKSFGPHFDVPSLDKGDVLFISCAIDMGFTRLRNIKGEYSIEYLDSDRKGRSADMKKDEVLKIWRKADPDKKQTIVMLLIAGPDGETKIAETFTEEYRPLVPEVTEGPKPPPDPEVVIIVPPIHGDNPTTPTTMPRLPPDKPTPTPVGVRL